MPEHGYARQQAYLVVAPARSLPAVTLTASNIHDGKQLEVTLDAATRVRGKLGRLCQCPQRPLADKDCDYVVCRCAVTSAASRLVSPALAWSHVNDWGGIAGRWSIRWPGSTATGD